MIDKGEIKRSKTGQDLSSPHLLQYSAYTGISYGFPHKIFIPSRQTSGFPVRAETETTKRKNPREMNKKKIKKKEKKNCE
jgi:hypothetical protein